MSTNHSRIELPQPGNHYYYELPRALQLQIAALAQLDQASAALDSVERDGRDLDLSADPTERDEWRNRQRDSLEAYRLYRRLEARAQLAYVRWLMARTDEEGDGARGHHLVALRRAEIETESRLLVLAQGE